MKYTTNLNLRKPEGSDIVDIDKLNENMDILDTEVASKETPTGAQSKVDTHNNIAASTTVRGHVQLSSATNSTSTTLAATASAVKAAWDLANGRETTTGAQQKADAARDAAIAASAPAGHTHSLTNLTDVTITSPAATHVVKHNGTQWINGLLVANDIPNLNASKINAGIFDAERLPTATTSVQGAISAADKTKLDGIAAGAQVNTVSSVAGRTGAVTLTSGDVGLANVDNIKQATKSEFDSHTGNSTVHITASERTAWNTRNFLNSPDNRGVNSPPSFYHGKANHSEFKQGNTVGLSEVNTQHGTLVSNHSWADDSGGQVVQIYYTDLGVFLRRSTSNTNWGSWTKMANYDVNIDNLKRSVESLGTYGWRVIHRTELTSNTNSILINWTDDNYRQLKFISYLGSTPTNSFPELYVKFIPQTSTFSHLKDGVSNPSHFIFERGAGYSGWLDIEHFNVLNMEFFGGNRTRKSGIYDMAFTGGSPVRGSLSVDAVQAALRPPLTRVEYTLSTGQFVTGSTVLIMGLKM